MIFPLPLVGREKKSQYAAANNSRTSLADAGRGAAIEAAAISLGDEIGLRRIEADIAQPLRDREFLQHRSDRSRRIVAAERILQPRLRLGRRFED